MFLVSYIIFLCLPGMENLIRERVQNSGQTRSHELCCKSQSRVGVGNDDTWSLSGGVEIGLRWKKIFFNQHILIKSHLLKI